MYIIKNKHKYGDVYFISFHYDKENNCNGLLLALTLNNATKFSNLKIATEQCIKINDNNFKIYNLCPKCLKEYDIPPAISRRANKTYICSNCETKEILFDFASKRA